MEPDLTFTISTHIDQTWKTPNWVLTHFGERDRDFFKLERINVSIVDRHDREDLAELHMLLGQVLSSPLP